MECNFLQTDLMEIMLQGVYVLNKDWQFTYLNKAAEDALKVKRDELLGTTIWEKFPLMVNSVIRENYLKTMRERTSISFEVKEIYTQIWKKFYVYPIDEGICVFFDDILEKKLTELDSRTLMEETLRDSEEKLRQAFDLAVVGMAIIDLTGTFVKANQSFCRFVGYTEQELLSLRCRDLTYWDDVQLLTRHEMRLFIGEIDSFQLEKRFICKGGEIVWGRVNASLFKDSSKKNQYIVAQVQDITQQKNAELAWYHSEEKFRLMFNNAVDIMGLLRLTNGYFSQILEINDIACSRFGYTKEELKNNTVFGLIAPEDRHKMPLITSKLQAAKFFRGELKGLTKLGEVIELELICRVFNLNNDQVVFVVARDITERKLAEETLRVSEERFRSAFGCAAIGMVITSLDGGFVKVNDAFSRMTGYTDKELIMKSYYDITLPQDSLKVFDNHISRLIDGKTNFCQFQTRLIHKKGHFIWVSASISVIRDGNGKPQFFIEQIQDITDQRRTEQALRDSEEKFRMIVDNANDGITLVTVNEQDKLNTVIEANKTAEQYYGNIKGRSFDDLFGRVKLNNVTVNEIFKRILHNEKVIWEEHAVGQDGVVRPLELSGKLFRINNERVILAVARDISERKLAENYLIEMNKKLKAVNEELVKTGQYKNDFLNTMTHELKTPLTAIMILTAELLSESIGSLTEEQEEYLKDIRESAKLLLDMINDLLALAKIESGKLGLDLTTMKVGSVAARVVKNLLPLKNDKEIKINLKITDEHIIVADAKQIGQVITNLLSNAIKFSKPKGTIELVVHDVLEPEGVMVKVKDDGPGIPEEEHQRIFESFYQVSMGLNKNYPGSGLGLALVKKIVNLYNGWVNVHSSPGRGSVFSVFLPVNPQFTDELD